MNRLIYLLFFIPAGMAFAQETEVRGKVTDSHTGDPLPFVNVMLKGTSAGATTDFNGNYLIRTAHGSDTLVASYVGYRPRTKLVKQGTSQVINIQLEEDVVNLQEFSIHAGENPAFPIMRSVIRNKDNNDKRTLNAYEFDTYTKTEIDIDNLSDSFRKRKIVRKITQVLDSVDRMAGEDGKPILPMFITESLSKYYYRESPRLKKEHILKTKINGVGVEDGTLITQLVGTSFQEYNFYQNWMNIINKEFVSPIADGWKLYYDYDLIDSLFIGKDFCYRIDFTPRSAQSLAFTGTMWITQREFALKQIDATVGKQANVNFLEKIKIQQELQNTVAGPWVPLKTRVLVDIGQPAPNAAGMLAKFYTSNKNVVVNQPKPVSFYQKQIEMAEDARMFENDKFWDTIRHEPLTQSEKNVYRMIDTLRSIPVVKTYTEIIKAFIDGYYNLGKVEVGPYLGFVAWNSKEGMRVQFGFKTNERFSRRWTYQGQLAYGFKDEKVKYAASVTRILSREHWTTLRFRIRSDIARLGVDDEALADNPIFLASTKWGIIRRGYYFQEQRVSLQRQFFKGFSETVSLRHWTFDPTYNFGYYFNPDDHLQGIGQQFQSSEISFDTHYARDETFLQNGNERVALRGGKWPVVNIRYTHGFKGVLNGSFDYDKLRMTVMKRFKAGPLGVGYITLSGEYVFNTLPYPLLAMHMGNQSGFYSPATYNLMNYGEFISDHYVSIRYRQYLEGFLLNNLPLIQKLKWRLLTTASVIEGGMRQANRNAISLTTPDPLVTALPAGYLDTRPYVELGYGVENIFKFLRIDFVHRLSYLDRPGARRFGVLFTAQFQL